MDWLQKARVVPPLQWPWQQVRIPLYQACQRCPLAQTRHRSIVPGVPTTRRVPSLVCSVERIRPVQPLHEDSIRSNLNGDHRVLFQSGLVQVARPWGRVNWIGWQYDARARGLHTWAAAALQQRVKLLSYYEFCKKNPESRHTWIAPQSIVSQEHRIQAGPRCRNALAKEAFST